MSFAIVRPYRPNDVAIGISREIDKCPICFDPFELGQPVMNHPGNGRNHRYHPDCITRYAETLGVDLREDPSIPCPIYQERVDISPLYFWLNRNCEKAEACFLTAIRTGILAGTICLAAEITHLLNGIEPKIHEKLLIGALLWVGYETTELTFGWRNRETAMKSALGLCSGIIATTAERMNNASILQTTLLAGLVGATVSGVLKAMRTNWR